MSLGEIPSPGQTGLDWRDGAVPVSRRFGDPYYSLDGGLDEAGHVFLAGNGLPGRFCDGFAIAELGFGTGLNLVAAILAWEAAGLAGRFAFTSFEAFPLSPDEIARALAGFGPAATWGERLALGWEGGRRFALGPADVTVIEGDARLTLPAWRGNADAWFLDGFAPAKNPELWEPDLLAEVARHSRQGATFATYTAAGAVRAALAGAGFTVERLPGYGRKRHMTRGWL
jgi:tRNA U34 5-methylaminomethyl-2-thiouridine-forming methyltransferase MnmC